MGSVAARATHRGLRGHRMTVAPLLVILTACEDPTVPGQPHPFLNPETASLQVDSAVALFECGYSTFAWIALGPEGVVQPVAGVVASAHVYRAAPTTGECDTSDTSQNWFDPIMAARTMISNAVGTGVYERIRDQWSLGMEGERLAAISSIYIAAALGLLGEFFCEMTFDAGPPHTPDEVLALAEEWITDRALVHIASHGDFVLPGGVAESAATTAIALRARIRWARGDSRGAVEDAERVPPGFTAWVSRDDGRKRRNKVHFAATVVGGFSSMLGPNDWWAPETRRPNPATGERWPNPIPFTGFRFLGILPDGRAVDDAGHAVRWAEEDRDPNQEAVPLNNGAVPDPRTEHHFASVSGPEPPEVPDKYGSESDDIPLVSWREMWLIRAKHVGGQAAIDLVDDLRLAAGLPTVAYFDGAIATTEQIRSMILEERRRSLYGEGGRFW
ncbi:MAG TPA: hypothetical protein VLA09_05845, partial [Longimicrobiales bacterium]|nr:hypothetical protein [Longimicrobiales bacterium]